MNVYLSSSWKNQERVRALAAALREAGHEVYDFTDPACRKSPEIPPEAFPEQFDPDRHQYRQYIAVPEWRQAVEGNREAVQESDAVVLMLPCGLDAHADAFYGLGLGKHLVVCGQPHAGERVPTHLWADAILDTDEAVVEHLSRLQERRRNRPCILTYPGGVTTWGIRRGRETEEQLSLTEHLRRYGADSSFDWHEKWRQVWQEEEARWMKNIQKLKTAKDGS